MIRKEEYRKEKDSIPQDWIRYNIDDIGEISIPPTLEFRDDNSAKASIKRILNNVIEVKTGLKLGNIKLTFEPKGSGEFDKKALSEYARVLVNFNELDKDDNLRWNLKLTKTELQELDKISEQEAYEYMKQLSQVAKGKIIKWNPIELGKTPNGTSFIKATYTRQMEDNPVVKVNIYNLYNYDETVQITISYRLSESDIWASDLDKIIDTFNFITKK